MNKKFEFDFPKIIVNKNQLFVSSESSNGKNLVKLESGHIRTVNDGLLLYSLNDNQKKKEIIASMSYKKIGQKLIKKISMVNGFDFYFRYNKENGYFDKIGNLVSPRGNEYSISDITWKKFYSELIDVLKLRLTLGYISSDDKKQPVDYYFRSAHKYILEKKYKLFPDECMNFLRGVVSKSYIPEEFTEGFLEELKKTFYSVELTKGEQLEIETMAKLSLMNEKKGKVPFDNILLYADVLNEIRSKNNIRHMNMVRLMESMNNNKD